MSAGPLQRGTDACAHKVDEYCADKAKAAPEEEYSGLEAGITWSSIDEVRGHVPNRPIEEPVGGRCYRHALGSIAERENLTRHRPVAGAPCGGESGNVDAHESN